MGAKINNIVHNEDARGGRKRANQKTGGSNGNQWIKQICRNGEVAAIT